MPNEQAQNTEIALLKKDIDSIGLTLDRMSKQMSDFNVVATEVASQKNINNNQERRLEGLAAEFASARAIQASTTADLMARNQDLRDEVRDLRYSQNTALEAKLDGLVKMFDTRFQEKEQRVRALENWRWYILGIMAAAGLVMKGLPWSIALGN